ncbi:SIS domain-containing protein [bacterium]|nr:SIS domain-containing protein [bacterium]
MVKYIKESYTGTYNLLGDFISNNENLEKTKIIGEKLAEIFNSGGKVIVFGNGGSATDAMHFAEEFTGRFRDNRKALPAIALSDASHLTCVGNDYGFDEVFARGVQAYAKAGDMVIGLSTSGNSANIIRGLEEAKKIACSTVALLGKDGGKLAGKCDYDFIIPGKTSDRIQELHMIILHIVIEVVERKMFPENY